MKTDKQTDLPDNLAAVLEKQIEMARKSDFRRVEALAQQADSIVEELVRTKTLEKPEFNARREDLTKLYKKLELMLAAAKDSAEKQLNRVGKVRKTLKVYRGSG